MDVLGMAHFDPRHVGNQVAHMAFPSFRDAPKARAWNLNHRSYRSSTEFPLSGRGMDSGVAAALHPGMTQGALAIAVLHLTSRSVHFMPHDECDHRCCARRGDAEFSVALRPAAG